MTCRISQLTPGNTMSGAFAYHEPCQLCPASGVAQLAHRGGNANRNYLEWGGTPIALAAEHPCAYPTLSPASLALALQLQFVD